MYIYVFMIWTFILYIYRTKSFCHGHTTTTSNFSPRPVSMCLCSHVCLAMPCDDTQMHKHTPLHLSFLLSLVAWDLRYHVSFICHVCVMSHSFVMCRFVCHGVVHVRHDDTSHWHHRVLTHGYGSLTPSCVVTHSWFIYSLMTHWWPIDDSLMTHWWLVDDVCHVSLI
jgi:hypothetical protein